MATNWGPVAHSSHCSHLAVRSHRSHSSHLRIARAADEQWVRRRHSAPRQSPQSRGGGASGRTRCVAARSSQSFRSWAPIAPLHVWHHADAREHVAILECPDDVSGLQRLARRLAQALRRDVQAVSSYQARASRLLSLRSKLSAPMSTDLICAPIIIRVARGVRRAKRQIVETTGARHGMSLISAITSRGHMRFMIKEKGGVNAAVFIEFLKRMMIGAKRPIFLIVDRGPAHVAKKTKAFVASLNGRLRLFLSSALFARPQSR